MKTIKQMTNSELVDGAQLAKQNKDDAISRWEMYTGEMKVRGLDRYYGSIADCTVIEVETPVTDWKGVCAEYNISPRVIKRYSTVRTAIRATIVNKQLEQKAAA